MRLLQCDWAQIQVIVLHNDGHGFGFGISGSRNSGAVVRNIFPGGAADRDGTLKNGDHLLAVGEVRLWGMGAEQVASILRQAGQDAIRLVIARPVDPTSPQYGLNCAIVPTKTLNDPIELERALQSGLAAAAGALAGGSNGFAFESVEELFPESYQTSMDVLPHNMGLSCNQSATTIHPITVLTESDGSVLISPSIHNTVLPIPTNGTLPGCELGFIGAGASVLVTQPIDTGRPLVSIFPGDSAPCAEDHLPTFSIQIPTTLPKSESSNLVKSETTTGQIRAESSNSVRAEMVVEVHTSEKEEYELQKERRLSSGQKVTLVTSPGHPDQVSIFSSNPSTTLPLSRAHTITESLNLRQKGTTTTTRKKSASTKTRSNRHHTGESDFVGGAKVKRSRGSVSCNTSNPSLHSNDKTPKRKCVGEGNCTSEEEPSINLPLGDLNDRSLSIGQMTSTPPSPSEQLIPEKEVYDIELTKDGKGLGITVAGYVCEKEDLCGIFVKSVIEGSMADVSGCIMVNDQITEVDSILLSGFTNQQAVELLKQTGHVVKLRIVRYLRGLKFQELQEGIAQADAETPTTSLQYLYTPNGTKNFGFENQGGSPTRGSSQATTVSSSIFSAQQCVTLPATNCPLPQQQQRQHCDSPCASSLGQTGATWSPMPETTAVSNGSSFQKQTPNHHNTYKDNYLHNASTPMVPDLGEVALTRPYSGPTPNQVQKTGAETEQGFQRTPSAKSKASPTNKIKTKIEVVDIEKEELQMKWEKLLGPKFTIVVSRLKKPDEKSGLGISLEGTVDVEGGKEVRPHHYIRSILPGGPVGVNAVLKSGDELLEVNGKSLKGLFHEDVVRSLRELPEEVCIVCARKASGPSPLRGTIVDNVDTAKSQQAFASRKILSGSLQSLLASAKEPEFLLKAKSDVSLACTTSQSISMDLSSGGLIHLPDETEDLSACTRSYPLGGINLGVPFRNPPFRMTYSALSAPPSTTRPRSRSLEPLNSAAMWSSQIEEIVLIKGEKGLGFSILDYQDPLNMSSMVIVVRSLVPGGVAQVDGRLVPGDRIMHVNHVSLEHASLDMAVQALKCAPFGPVSLGIARPLITGKESEVRRKFEEKPNGSKDGDGDNSPKRKSSNVKTNYSGDSTAAPSESALPSENSVFQTESLRESVSDNTVDGSIISDLKTECVTDCCDGEPKSSSSSTVDHPNPCGLIRNNLTPVYNLPVLPDLPKFSISIRKAPGEMLGIQLEALAYELCGTLVRQIEPSGLVYRDGRLRTGDLILYLNHESLWRVTSSQAKTILRRAELVSTGIPIVFVPEENLFGVDESSEEDRTDDSASESLKLSEIQTDFAAHRNPSLCSCRSDEIVPDLTVESGVTTLRRFPSDLLESSVDPDLPANPNNLNETRTSGASSQLSEGLVQLEPDDPEPSPELVKPSSPLNPVTPLATEHSNKSKHTKKKRASCQKEKENCATSTSDMVRVYSQPPSLSQRQLIPSQSTISSPGANGFQSPVVSPVSSKASLVTELQAPGAAKAAMAAGTAKAWGEVRSVDVFRVQGAGLGISIVSGRVEGSQAVSGIFIKNVLPDSPAGNTGKLFTGDRLVEVGGVQLTNADQDVAVMAIKNAGNPVNFVVQSLLPNDQLPIWQGQQPRRFQQEITEPEMTSSPEQNQDQAYDYSYKCLNEVPSSPDLVHRRLTAESIDAKQLTKVGNCENGNISAAKPDLVDTSAVRKMVAAPKKLEVDPGRMTVPTVSQPQCIISGSSTPASRGDLTPQEPPEIIQPGLTDVERQTLQQKLQTEIQIRKEEHLTVYRKSSIEETDSSQVDMKSTIVHMDDEGTKQRPKAKKLKSLSISSDSGDDDEDADEKINRTENFKALPGEVIEIEVKRNKYGLGLALAGHKDRNRMGTYICGIHPDGPVARDGRLCPGDELLKIHTTVVRGRSHLNVSAIIKRVPQDVKVRIVVLRNKVNQEKVAIKNFNHFPLLLDDVIFSSPEFEDFKARREVKMQKTSEGIGLMIIEGSHKVLGKGIFVSDIQQDSLAFKAELKVGDMVLAVNTESFLTVSYDEAALILKQLTGFVRMLVVNPADEINKRNEEQNLAPNNQKDGATTPSKTPQLSPAKSPVNNSLAPTVQDGSRSPAKSPAKSPARTPAKSPCKSPSKSDANKIELKKDSNGLGLSVVGGSDTPLGGVIVHEVYKNGAADKDGRLQPGDRILSVNGTAFNELTHEEALRILRSSQDRVVVIIDPKTRDASDIYQDREIELQKKPGKGLGLSVVGRRDGKGVFISDMVSGGIAEANGQLLRGDQIMAVNDKDLSQAVQDQAVAVLKTVTGNVKLKVRRYKFITA